MALDRIGAVVQLDDVGAVGSLAGAHAGRARPEPQRDAVGLQGVAEQCRRARMVLVVDPVPRVDQRDRHAIACVDLGQLDARRPRAEDRQRAGQLAGRGALDVRPRVRLAEAGEVARHPADRSDRQHDRTGLEHAVADADASRAVERGRPADDGRAGPLEALHVARVVGRIGPLAVDHVVAEVRRLRPRVVAATVVDRGSVEERLRGHARPERARAAEEAAVDDRHRCVSRARVVGSRLAGRAGADDDEVVSVHALMIRAARPRPPRRRSRSGSA